MIRLRFRYLNWHDVDHEYVIDCEGMTLGIELHKHGKAHVRSPDVLFLHGQVVTRDSEPRPGRRSFVVADLREVAEVTSDPAGSTSTTRAAGAPVPGRSTDAV